MVDRINIPAAVPMPPKKMKCDVCFNEFFLFELTAWKLTKNRDIAVCNSCKKKITLGVKHDLDNP